MTPECLSLGLAVEPVADDHTVEVLRWIRNLCKDGFAHDNTEISQAAQHAWWILNRSRVRAWLYWTIEQGVIGYGLVRQTDDGRWWSSVAVIPDAAGHGYGGAITADLVRRCDHPVYGEARQDQPKAMRLHREADWELQGYSNGLALYRTREHVWHPVLSEWAETGVVIT